MSIHSNRGYTTIYVSPNGTGAGSSADDPAYFKDVFAKLTSNYTKTFVTVKCLPGTYDFEDSDTYYVTSFVKIIANDNSNKPVFTRSSAVDVSKYLFQVYEAGNVLSFNHIIFDKWSAGRGDTDTDIPACAKAYGGGEVRILNCEVRATKFSGAISGVYCFAATNKDSQITILANLYTSDPTLLFNAPNSTAPGSSSYNCYLCYGDNGGYITGFTSATLYMEIKAGALGSALIVFSRLKKTEYAASTFDITFDSCYKLIIAAFVTNISINLKQQGYNSDGTVDNTAVGGTDYKVYSTLLDLNYSANCRITINLKSDVFCETHFISASRSSGQFIITTDGNAWNINSSASGNGASDNSAISLTASAFYFLINGNVTVNDTTNLKFDYGVDISTPLGPSVLQYLSTSPTISGRTAALRLVNHAKVYVDNVALENATNGLYLNSADCRCMLLNTGINNNTTGINIENGSKVTTNNVTFSGNTNNYSANANVSSATADVRTV